MAGVTVDRVLGIAPQASAGEGGTVCNSIMTPEQLQFQCRQLAGRDVVYTIAVSNDGSSENRAGNLVERHGQFFIRSSERLSHLRNVRPWEGVADESPFPPHNMRVLRVIAAHVHMGELMVAREEEVARLLDAVRQLENRNMQLERHLGQCDQMLQQRNIAPPNRQAMSPYSPYNPVSPAGAGQFVSPFNQGPPAGGGAGSFHGSFHGSGAMAGGIGGGPNQRYSNQQILDLNFFMQAFPGRDQHSMQQWCAQLHQQELRSLYDVKHLTQHQWDMITLPIFVKSQLQDMAGAAY